MTLTENTRQYAAEAAWQGGTGSVRDFVSLLKPRVMSLSIFTALVGLIAAPVSLHPVLAAVSILCIAVGAGASGALNMWYDSDIDALMNRTRGRPIPSGRITRSEALAFGTTLAIGSVLVLGLAANWAAAALLAFTIFFYVVVYTMWLKRSTPQNIVIGGAAGAFPPMIGWAAATGGVSVESVVMFAIIFIWTPPHFWALALFKSDDFRRARLPMMPLVAGETSTRRQILAYSIVLAPVGVLPYALGFAGSVYGAAASCLGAAFLYFAYRVFRAREGDAARRAAISLFSFSILYLFLLYVLLLADSVMKDFGLAG